MIHMLEFKVVPEVSQPFLIFSNSCFFILFRLNVYFFLLLQTVDLSPDFLPVTVGSLNMLYFILGVFHFFFHFLTKLNHFCEHLDYQYFELCVRLFISSSLSSLSGILICSFI